MRALMIDDGVKARIAQALKEAPTIPYEVLKRYGQKARAVDAVRPRLASARGLMTTGSVRRVLRC